MRAGYGDALERGAPVAAAAFALGAAALAPRRVARALLRRLTLHLEPAPQ
jgi:hypothetical protein